jgi:hypothetical protein
MTPYLLDLFEQHSEELHEALPVFCRCLCRVGDGCPGDELLDHVFSHKQRIIDVLLKAMDVSSGKGVSDASNFRYLLAGLAAVFGLPEFGDQITSIEL